MTTQQQLALAVLPPPGISPDRFEATKAEIAAHLAARGVVADDREIDQRARTMYAIAKAVAVAIRRQPCPAR